ncbi:hypothetical protein [Microbacterium sp.]|uniref:hypothetical protein n=1 Tax=Microbacterium sp. TaxID=51671 RepID=UPI00333ED5E1
MSQVLLIVVAVAHAVSIPALILLRRTLESQLAVANPGLPPADVAKLVLLEIVRTASFHGLLAVVCGVYAAKLPSGSRRVFRIVVASQMLSIVFGALTWFISPETVRWISPPFVLAAVVILVLLQGSATTRAFFTVRRRSEAGAAQTTSCSSSTSATPPSSPGRKSAPAREESR